MTQGKAGSKIEIIGVPTDRPSIITLKAFDYETARSDLFVRIEALPTLGSLYQTNASGLPLSLLTDGDGSVKPLVSSHDLQVIYVPSSLGAANVFRYDNQGNLVLVDTRLDSFMVRVSDSQFIPNQLVDPNNPPPFIVTVYELRMGFKCQQILYNKGSVCATSNSNVSKLCTIKAPPISFPTVINESITMPEDSFNLIDVQIIDQEQVSSSITLYTTADQERLALHSVSAAPCCTASARDPAVAAGFGYFDPFCTKASFLDAAAAEWAFTQAPHCPPIANSSLSSNLLQALIPTGFDARCTTLPPSFLEPARGGGGNATRMVTDVELCRTVGARENFNVTGTATVVEAFDELGYQTQVTEMRLFARRNTPISNLLSPIASIAFTITPVNNPPQLGAPFAGGSGTVLFSLVQETVSAEIRIIASDADGDCLAIQFPDLPSNGTLYVDANSPAGGGGAVGGAAGSSLGRVIYEPPQSLSQWPTAFSHYVGGPEIYVKAEDTTFVDGYARSANVSVPAECGAVGVEALEITYSTIVHPTAVQMYGLVLADSTPLRILARRPAFFTMPYSAPTLQPLTTTLVATSTGPSEDSVAEEGSSYVADGHRAVATVRSSKTVQQKTVAQVIMSSANSAPWVELWRGRAIEVQTLPEVLSIQFNVAGPPTGMLRLETCGALSLGAGGASILGALTAVSMSGYPGNPGGSLQPPPAATNAPCGAGVEQVFSLRFFASPGFVGTDAFSVQATDGVSFSSVGRVALTVTVNSSLAIPPAGAVVEFVLDGGSSVDISLLLFSAIPAGGAGATTFGLTAVQFAQAPTRGAATVGGMPVVAGTVVTQDQKVLYTAAAGGGGPNYAEFRFIPIAPGPFATAEDAAAAAAASAAQPVSRGILHVRCPAGTTVDPTSFVCIACAAGRYQGAAGVGGRCQLCPPGSYSATAGALQCTPCPAGHFADHVGADQCTACPPGTFGGAAGLAGCSRCPLGTFMPFSASTTCKNCGLEAYNPTGRTSCFGCPTATRTFDLQASTVIECQCQAGFFNTPGCPGRECEECPPDAECTGGRAAPLPTAGFWTNAALWIAGNQSAMQECGYLSIRETCTGLAGRAPFDLGYTVLPNASQDSCRIDNSGYSAVYKLSGCSSGYTGRICSACEDGQGGRYWRSFDGTCEPCPTGVAGAVAFFVFAVLPFVTFWAVVITVGVERLDDSGEHAGLNAVVGMAAMQMIDWAQLAGALARYEWPMESVVKSHLSFLTLFNFDFDFLPWACYGFTVPFLAQRVLMAALPELSAGCIMLLWYIRRSYIRRRILKGDRLDHALARINISRGDVAAAAVTAASNGIRLLTPGSRPRSSFSRLKSAGPGPDLPRTSGARPTTSDATMPGSATKRRPSTRGASRGGKDAPQVAAEDPRRARTATTSATSRRSIYGGSTAGVGGQQAADILSWEAEEWDETVRCCLVVFALLQITSSLHALELVKCRSDGDQVVVLDAMPDLVCWDANHSLAFSVGALLGFLHILVIPIYIFLQVAARYAMEEMTKEENVIRFGWLYAERERKYWWWWFVAASLRRAGVVSCASLIGENGYGQVWMALIVGLLEFVGHALFRPYLDNRFNQMDVVMSCGYLAMLLASIPESMRIPLAENLGGSTVTFATTLFILGFYTALFAPIAFIYFQWSRANLEAAAAGRQRQKSLAWQAVSSRVEIIFYWAHRRTHPRIRKGLGMLKVALERFVAWLSQREMFRERSYPINLRHEPGEVAAGGGEVAADDADKQDRTGVIKSRSGAVRFWAPTMIREAWEAHEEPAPWLAGSPGGEVRGRHGEEKKEPSPYGKKVDAIVIDNDGEDGSVQSEEMVAGFYRQIRKREVEILKELDARFAESVKAEHLDLQRELGTLAKQKVSRLRAEFVDLNRRFYESEAQVENATSYLASLHVRRKRLEIAIRGEELRAQIMLARLQFDVRQTASEEVQAGLRLASVLNLTEEAAAQVTECEAKVASLEKVVEGVLQASSSDEDI